MRRGLRASLLVLSGCLVVGSLAAGDVVLHPGTITGTIGLSNWTPASTAIAISGNANGFSASTSTSTDSYTLTIESDQTYNFVSVAAQMPSANGVSGHFNISKSEAGIYVPPSGTTVLNLVRPGGALSFHVSVVGGTVTGYQASASGVTGFNEYGSGALYSSTGADATLPLPAMASAIVTGSATVAIVDVDGNACTIALPFSNQTVTVAEGGPTSIAEELAVTTGCSTGIHGTVGIDGLPSGVTPNDTYVYATGPQYKSLDVYGNHQSYKLDGLALGTYSVRAQMTFNPPYAKDFLTLPNTNPSTVTLTAEMPVVERDFIFGGAVVSGNVIVSGTPSSLLNTAFVQYQGKYDPSEPDGGATYGGVVEAGLSGFPNAHFAGIFTEGVWSPRMSLFVFKDQGAAIPMQDLLTIYHYSDPEVTVATGQSRVVPTQSLPLTEGLVVFDVVEPPGSPVIGISNPNVYAHKYDPAAGSNINSDSYTYVTNADTPAVRVIAPPGVYAFEAYATVQGSYAQFASSTITLGAPVDTPVGTHVVVSPTDPAGQSTPVTLYFAEVTQAGQSTVSSTDVGPGAPPGYSLLSIIHDDHYMSVATSAGFPSQVEVCLKYDLSALSITSLQEPSLKLQEFVCTSSTSCAWQVVNGAFPGDNGGVAVNTSTHTICGLTTKLATFALTLPNLIQVPPTDTCVGADGEPAPLTTDPGACSVSIDNTNQIGGGCAGGGGGLMSCTFDGAASESLGLGAHAVAITGTATDGSLASCTSYVTVADREAPSVLCPAPRVVECAGTTTHVAETATCTDNCSCTASCDGGTDFVPGATTLACNAVDGSGNKGSCSTVVTVVDTKPPVASVAVTPTVLWPPNHKLVAIQVNAAASDGCDAAPVVTCAATSNEPDNGLGDGDTANDIQWKNGVLFLRAERSGGGAGRVYTVTCTGKDASGNLAHASTTVTVPLAQATN